MAASESPLRLTIRFSNSTPDLPLDIPNPETTTVASLKSTLRETLPKLSLRRLRFIHQGRILPDADPLLDALDPKQKGKFPLHTRIFLNCSIGDVLDPADLASESRIASQPAKRHAAPAAPAARPEARRERGFDRLLSAGFSPAEVNQLRLQFRSVHAARHTPDTMPSTEAMRALEDAWMDDNGPSAAAGSEETLAGGDDMAGAGGGVGALLDVFLQGIFTGFFLPMGSLAWLLREEGMWSKRRQVAVVFGVVVSVVVGLLRVISGEGE
ncbi:related to conserved membrane protein, putative [Cephalotrichum gorgonifer]|uniref:Related to conserved membrane protein, putative n=1 Tax=Cephalotrichum gorgonifer TaxID=2041049 RepID=A0AAE8SW10_9PEZI|nr:related to conserved membrane protein, putative [Cephalotrichum gorgonifer]